MSQAPQPNALAGETSPYLLQHARNPVQWFPWCDAALARARREDKPILLSIGYSACHWCHVMAHESFEDQATAELMNRLYVNVKVDREERPDLDRIYQLSHQLLSRRPGGWPLTVVLTPDDLTPFFAGTYFPREPRHGMPAFRDVLARIEQVYREHRDEIRSQNASLLEALASLEPGPPGAGVALGPEPLDGARAALHESFDERHGGFSGAPKFPHPTSLERLLRHHAATAAAGRPDAAALALATFSLRRMCLGGIYDQLGGGFARYSVDEQWMIPHFEKMLYDNGPLLALAAEAWQLTGDPVFARVARETGAWVMREMQAPEGGYYSSLDADSEGEEGRYYVWTPQEVEGLLGAEELAVLAPRFGLDRAPNFEGRHWHLHVFREIEELALRLSLDPDEVRARLDSGRARLLAAREERVRPGRDDKVLTAWNGLMIRGMARAGRVLGEPAFVHSAERALDFIRATLWRDGRLLATAKDGRAHLPAYLDDYAFLADGVLALLEARWRDGDLEFAVALAEVLLAHFEDPDAGGFFFTADDHEALLYRPKPLMDESLPSGNGVAAQVLGRLGHLLGETRYLDAAERTLKAAWAGMQRAPHAHTALLHALEEHLFPPQTVVLRGTGAALAEWHARAGARYAPRRLVLAIPEDASPPGPLAARTALGTTTAYLCEGMRCGEPVTDLAAFDAALRTGEVARAG